MVGRRPGRHDRAIRSGTHLRTARRQCKTKFTPARFARIQVAHHEPHMVEGQPVVGHHQPFFPGIGERAGIRHATCKA